MTNGKIIFSKGLTGNTWAKYLIWTDHKGQIHKAKLPVTKIEEKRGY